MAGCDVLHCGTKLHCTRSRVDVCIADVLQSQYGDIVLLDAPEGYEHLWRKVGQGLDKMP